MLANPLPYLYVFLQTNLLEFPIYYYFYRKRCRTSEILTFTLLVNLVTHPIVFFGFMASHQSYLASILEAESFAIVAEGLLGLYFLKKGSIPARTTFSASFFANLFSWQIAPLLTYFFFY